MSYKPLPSKRGLPGGAIKLAAETSSIADSTTSKQEEDIGRRIWTETQWVNLTKQAIDLGLPKLPYFDPQTMLLSKEVNKNLWRQLIRLYKVLGPEQAPYAQPKMIEGGEVKWYSWLGESKGQEATSPPLASVLKDAEHSAGTMRRDNHRTKKSAQSAA